MFVVFFGHKFIFVLYDYEVNTLLCTFSYHIKQLFLNTIVITFLIFESIH
jgi:hypothetical protein